MHRLNDYLAAKWGISAQRIVQLEIAGFAGAAFTMMQIGEHLAAILCWLAVFFIWVVQAASWQGISNRTLSTILKVLYLLVVFMVCTLGIAVTVARKGNEPWSNLQKFAPRPCSISVEVNDVIVDRVHLRARWLPSGSGRTTEVYKPMFQDLFHDFVITVTPSSTASDVRVIIQDQRKPKDTLRIDSPDSAQATEPKPQWVSGFEESTQTPDFYVRSVTFATMHKPAAITIRKAIKMKNGQNTITGFDLDLDRTVQVSAEGVCKVVTIPTQPVKARLDRLGGQIKILLVQINAGGLTVTRPDPDEPYPPLAVNESEMVNEITCKDDPWTNRTVKFIEKTRVQ